MHTRKNDQDISLAHLWLFLLKKIRPRAENQKRSACQFSSFSNQKSYDARLRYYPALLCTLCDGEELSTITWLMPLPCLFSLSPSKNAFKNPPYHTRPTLHSKLYCLTDKVSLFATFQSHGVNCAAIAHRFVAFALSTSIK